MSDLLYTISQNPAQFAVRVALTLLVALVAAYAGAWLSRHAARAPVALEPHHDATSAEDGLRVVESPTAFRRLSRLTRGALFDSARVAARGRPLPPSDGTARAAVPPAPLNVPDARIAPEARSGFGYWLGQVTLVSVWLAAAAAMLLIWFTFWNTSVAITPKEFQAALFDLLKRLCASLVVFACALGLGQMAQRAFVHSVERSRVNRLNGNLTLLGGRLIYLATLALAVVVILAIWGTGLVVPVTLLGALTVALTVALQDMLKNLVSGVYLSLERPFVLHDRISLFTAAPYTGEVEDIHLRYTALRTADGQRVLVPNSTLFSSVVVNLSAYNRRRAALTLSVPGGAARDIERLEDGVAASLEAVPQVLRDPPPQVILSRVTGEKVDVQVIFWLPTADPDDMAETLSDVVERLRGLAEGAEVTLADALTVAG